MIPHPADERYAGLAWADHPWTEIERAAEQGYLAVLPLGSVEQHGPMIPVGCDLLIAASRCLEAARIAREKHGVNSLVLPPVPYGCAAHHTDFAGTVSLEIELYIRLIKNLLREVVRPGFRRVVLVSGHGGNDMPAKVAMRALGAEMHTEGVRDVRFYVVDGRNCYTEAGDIYGKLPQGQFNFHADAVETSMYLLARPDLVRREGMVRPDVKVEAMPLHENWRTREITETGASGDPTLADPAYGAECCAYFAEAAADFLKRVAEEP